jgi:hypothetical protein
MKSFFTSLLIFIVSISLAQTTLTGKVSDEKGEPIPGANIVIKDTYDGTSSGLDGTFQFVTTETGAHVVVITFIGYKTFAQQVGLDGKPVTITARLRETINELEAVVISAGSFTAGEEKRRTVLKAVDIATTAGATADIAGALNTLPGTQKVGESGRLFVRGGDDNEARTFIDGIAVMNPYGAAAPNTPSRGRFLPFMFKGTSFSTGGYSAEYGQALSSALILDSKDKAEMNQTDIGLLSVGADVAHTQVWERSSLSAKAQYTNVAPYFGLINQVVDWKFAPRSMEGSAAYRREFGKDGLLKFFGNVNQSRLSMYNHDIAQPAIKQQYDLANDYYYGNASYRKVLNANWNIRGGASATYNRNGLKVEGAPMDETERGVHAKFVAENSISSHVELRLGAELLQRDYTALNPSAQLLAFSELIPAAFAEVEAYASNRFVAKVGARAEHNSLEGSSAVDPRLSVAYKPGNRAAQNGQFSFAYGRFRQSVKNQYLRLNTGLNQEVATHYILNYQVLTGKRTFRVETYYKKYDELVLIDQSNPLLVSNGGDGYARGFELFWRDNSSLKNVDYWVSYSFLDTKRTYLDYPIAAVPTFASKHNFSVVYKHFITKWKSQLGVTYSFSSGRPYFDPNSEKFHATTTPFYQDISANVAYLPKNWLIVFVSCTNLAGRDNIFNFEFASSPDANGYYAGRPVRQAAPRFLFVGVFITISKNKSVNQLPNL